MTKSLANSLSDFNYMILVKYILTKIQV